MGRLESLDHGMAGADATRKKPIVEGAKKKSIGKERKPTMGDDAEDVVVKPEMATTSGPTDGGGKVSLCSFLLVGSNYSMADRCLYFGFGLLSSASLILSLPLQLLEWHACLGFVFLGLSVFLVPFYHRFLGVWFWVSELPVEGTCIISSRFVLSLRLITVFLSKEGQQEEEEQGGSCEIEEEG